MERQKRPMITTINPNWPDAPEEITKRKDWPKFFIGYWAFSSDPERDIYKELNLAWPEDYIDLDWDVEERNRIADHLKKGGKVALYYCGYADCRICGEKLGCSERYDGTYLWPDGFDHYLVEHGVKPPEQFIKHVLTKK